VARAVGFIGVLFALAAVVPTLGWMAYTDPQWKLRPNPLNDDWRLYEQAALMLGWLLLFVAYWRAVRGVRVAIRDYLDANPA
jgi:succinate dehydrogenase hydrophobic anchor subunit